MLEFKSFGSSSDGNLYKLSDGITNIMIEAGFPIKYIQKAFDYEVTSLDGALISHSHGDHAKSVKDVVKMGVDCYMSKTTSEEIGVEHNRVRTFETKKQFKIGTFTILPFPLKHDVENHGFLIQSDGGERFLFVTDSYYCPFRFENLNIIAIECNYSEKIINQNVEDGKLHPFLKKRINKSHFSLENLLSFFKANDLSQVKEIHLLHLSDNNGDPVMFKEEVQKATGKHVIIAK